MRKGTVGVQGMRIGAMGRHDPRTLGRLMEDKSPESVRLQTAFPKLSLLPTSPDLEHDAAVGQGDSECDSRTQVARSHVEDYGGGDDAASVGETQMSNSLIESHRRWPTMRFQ
jgi:hypothetical protein